MRRAARAAASPAASRRVAARPEDAPPPKRPDDSDDEKRDKKAKRIDKRGDDWALPQKRPVPITRPIHVNCYSDRLDLVPEAPRRQPRSPSP